MEVKDCLYGVVFRTIAETNPNQPMIIDITMWNTNTANPELVYQLKVGKLAQVLATYGSGDYLPYTHGDYRFGYNGMEVDPEQKGQGNSYTTEFRQYDPRLGRWLSVDPLASAAPGWTPYRAFFDNPIAHTDLSGLYETKREARQARRGASDHGYSCGKIEGRKGHYSFRATLDRNSDGEIDEYCTFYKKRLSIKPGPYKGGIELFEAAEARGAVPYGESRAIEAFKVGEYRLLPNYVNGKLSHYTASVWATDPNTYQQVVRVDYIIGREKLDYFIAHYQQFASAANLAFGANIHLQQWQIDYANEKYASAAGGYLKSQWTPANIVLSACGTACSLTQLSRTVIRNGTRVPHGHLPIEGGPKNGVLYKCTP